MSQQETLVNVKGAIKTFIIDNFLFGNEDEPFSEEDSFLENGIIDSTGVLELIEFIEEKFRINTEDDELIPENLDSLNNVTNYVIRKGGTF